MSQPRTVGTAILDLLAGQGIDVAFGLPGVHNLAFWSSETAVRVIGVRHEQAAVYAADGYARATGRLGLAFSTTGPGAMNAMAAFGEAAVSGSPVLLVASDVTTALRSPGGPRGILHEMADQAAPFAAFGVRAVTATSGEQVLEEVARALAGGSPAEPAYLGVPSDILAAPWTGPLPSVPPAPAHVMPRPADVTALAELLRHAPRVVIWAGGGVTQCGDEGERAIAAIAERLGAPVVTTYAGRGVMAGHPLVVEASVHEPEMGALIGGSDLLLVVGSGFDAMNTKNWKMAMPPRRAAIGLGRELPRTVDWDVLVDADLVATLTAVDAELEAAGAAARQPWHDPGVRAAIRHRVSNDPRTAEAVSFVEAVETWPTDGVIVTDMCIPGYWTSSHAVQPRPRRLLNPVGWGTLGFALPAAIGPAAAGIPSLAVCGDGGPMFGLGELATYVQERLPITLVVVDDGGYGMLRFDQRVFGHDERGVDLVTPDWALLAASFGIPFAEVSDGVGLRAALAEGAARSGPSLVLWRAGFYPPASTSPRWFETDAGPRETA